jgi:hypothetical protein
MENNYVRHGHNKETLTTPYLNQIQTMEKDQIKRDLMMTTVAQPPLGQLKTMHTTILFHRQGTYTLSITHCMTALVKSL